MRPHGIISYTSPFWKGDTVTDECVYPVANKEGEYIFTLMCRAVRIISVTNYIMTATYREGRDYVLEDGRLRILPEGEIPTYPYSHVHPTENPRGFDSSVFYPRRDGCGFEYWNEGLEMAMATLRVTYVHDGRWHHPVPLSVRDRLSGTVKKLEDGEPLRVVVNGDSVSVGALSSGRQGIMPFAPAYPEMTVSALGILYKNRGITLKNTAVGGTTADFTEESLWKLTLSQSPELLIMNYGMNDSSKDIVGVPGEVFGANIKGRIERVREHFPLCEIILVSSLYGNVYTFSRERYEEHANILRRISSEYEGVGYVDPQRIMGSIMDSGKEYISFMADNMVHPNDLGMRLTAQSLLWALGAL